MEYQRTEKAIEILNFGAIEEIDNDFDIYKVTTPENHQHIVKVNKRTGEWSCDCQDYLQRKIYCKHIQAAFINKNSI